MLTRYCVVWHNSAISAHAQLLQGRIGFKCRWLHRVVVAIERNLKIAKDRLPPNAEIVSQVVDVCKLLSEPSDYNDTEDIASKSSIGKSCL
jgi:hypothetical protein